MKNIILLLFVISLSACSIFQSGEKEEQNTGSNDSSEEVYVFDEVSENDVNTKDVAKEIEKVKPKPKDASIDTEEDVFDESVVNNETATNYSKNKFYLQLGAFSTLKRAEKFVNDNNSQINLVLSIIYDSNTALYTVRSSAYNSKPEVEKIKNDFWNKNLYKDAFIVTE